MLRERRDAFHYYFLDGGGPMEGAPMTFKS